MILLLLWTIFPHKNTTKQISLHCLNERNILKEIPIDVTYNVFKNKHN